MRLFSVIAVTALLACQKASPPAPAKDRITLAQIETLFAQMRGNDAVDLNAELLWGYYFTDRDRGRLEKAAVELHALGYRLVRIEPAGGKGNDGLFMLHVEKVEHHTPASLHARNTELYALAERLGLTSYDGMDVGRADGRPFEKPQNR